MILLSVVVLKLRDLFILQVLLILLILLQLLGVPGGMFWFITLQQEL